MKGELKTSFEEQEKQTHINALTAILTSKQQAIAQDRYLLSQIKSDYKEELINNNDNGKTVLIMHTQMIEYRINKTAYEISFYEGQIEGYVPCIYVRTEDDDE